MNCHSFFECHSINIDKIQVIKEKQMDYLDWEILRHLKENRNITKTAQELFLTQPTVTKRLQQIEREFQTQLFIRHSKGIILTPEGLFLTQKAGIFLNEYDNIKANIHCISNENIQGTLRLAANYPFARGELPRIMAGFLRLYPRVTCDIQTGYSQKNYYKLCSGELPLGFIRENYSWPHKKLLVSEEKIYALFNQPFYLDNLATIPEIRSRFHYRLASEKEQWWNSHFSTPPISSITVEDSSIAAEFVRQGLGFTVCPGILIRGREQEFYRLPLTDKNEQFLTRQTWLYYQEKSLENPVVRLFVEFLKIYLKENENLTDPTTSQDPKAAYCGIANTINIKSV